MKRRRKRSPWGRMHFPHALEQAYLRQLLPIAEQCQRQVDLVFLPALAHFGFMSTVPKMDAISTDLGLLGRTAARAVIHTYDARLMRDLLRAKAGEIDDFQRKQLTRRLAKATTIENLTGRIMAKAAADRLVKGFVEENVALIQSIPEKVFTQVERKVLRAVRTGTRVETLRDELKSTYDITRSKAALIARDQVGKLYGQLNEARQSAVGIKTYIWRTVADERVRESHQELDGSVQEWATAPVTNDDGDENHPGEDYQCRCTAEPNLDELDLDQE